ncbi:MAG: exodeoxyribonuclease VII small subunit [Candidatus Dormibacteraeota bacterium]|uniref:Exodeoxyribonuclease VII small subunit n=1 Tax=Candidatus Dormiibacter inghamiae TaxID=3127013 RepID=A0A934KK73_9BACT|nr:exodeoxyribonuclease VII small subunit [Candidatus Dormibacteraeota bacterium]MBJ7607478.1 exodeoxyribonuclease VII small subunit [Candidatus Dormibacteraeota bacterium]
MDTLLDRLEAALQRLNDPRAPVQQIVADYELAERLLREAEVRLEQARTSLGHGRSGA